MEMIIWSSFVSWIWWDRWNHIRLDMNFQAQAPTNRGYERWLEWTLMKTFSVRCWSNWVANLSLRPGKLSWDHSPRKSGILLVLSHHETQTMVFPKNNYEFSFSKMGSRVVPTTWGNDLAAGFGNKENWNSNLQPLWLVNLAPPLSTPPQK